MPRVRVFVEYKGELRRAFELRTTKTDASLYLHPAAPYGVYDYGGERFPADALSHTFNPFGQLRSKHEPHVSIKQSGRVHIRTRTGPLAGPLQIPPLASLRGQHVATVTATRFDAFPMYQGDRKNLKPDYDQLVYVDPGLQSGRLCLYVNGATPTFDVPSERIAFTATVPNAALAGPLYVALAPWGQEPLGDDPAIVVLAGFDPTAADADDAPFLFLRGV